MAVEPRTVSIRFAYGPPLDPADSEQYYTRVVSPTPVPAPLQTCAEARYLGLYQRVSAADHFPCSDPEPEPYNNRRYFWLNWDVDMIDIHDYPFAAFNRIVPMIKRLRFQSGFYEFIRDRDDYWWYQLKWLDHIFPKVEEMQIVCAPGCKVED
ncbi:hypothetical protein SMACR_06153 [Sordaria macrospora]|uniref:WGS project CABT00000000 data, contig 2.33 n=2 Tax=Sordaria macrospora TaxID=5147 RepID=F7W671_SORMK|nr:uncharacterized protein SMAC_06153 [Sordaria macrospora k-hell]KAA8628013.1 hypothetical protein SMACR_06153 [Sordaria macrospora]KAH7630323.1 hypothetical protein B0T09DRAFT_366214 [Sordaria sp. MPI-SDFR-AT-0083]WPJ66989.1 hypothetical protein SMAC4_06153 [Sordaria macrospora]CCC13009.1 unnamed protein product [Sordaria macrospora k-hell]